MGLVAPWFLAGLAALALPVYFHLLRQHRTTPRRFSSLMFFERSAQSSIKHRRLRHLSLLALRVALLALLALAFAGPYVLTTPSASAGGRKLLLLVVDNSFSMRAGDRLERARRQALDALSGLREGDEGQVGVLASRLELLTLPTPERNELAAAIQSIRAGDGRSSYGELARALRSMAETARFPMEVHLFSDMQATSMPPGFADLQLPAGTRLELHPLAQETEPNFAVQSVVAPASLFRPDKASVQATIAVFGPGGDRRTVSLVVNGQIVESKTVEFPENGRATAEFHSLEAPYGFSRCEIRLDGADSLAEDDRFRFAVERADPRPALFVHRGGRARDLLYFRAALESSENSAFRLQAVEADRCADVDPTRFAVVVLSDPGILPTAFAGRLERYVRAGGAVLIALGPATARAERVPVVDAPVIEAHHSARSGERFLAVDFADATHPVVRDAAGFDGAKFYYTVRVSPGNARALARLGGESPLLLEQQVGEGRVLLFASTFDNVSNDFPLQPAFVPFVEQSMNYLAGVEARTSVRLVDSFVELRAPGAQAGAVEVIDPDGNRPLTLEEAASLTSFPLLREGFFEIKRAGDRAEMVAVNADRRESDLTVAAAETLALWQNTGEETVEEVAAAEAQRRRNLWWYVMLVAMAVGLGESVVARRYLAVERGAS